MDEVSSDEKVLLVWGDLDVVRSDDWLNFIWVVKTLDVAEVRNVEGSDVVSKSDGEVGELSVIRDVRVDSKSVLGLWTEGIEELCNTLLARRVLAERVDDPDFTCDNSGSESSGFVVSWDELDVLDTTSSWDFNGGDDGSGVEIPKTEGVGTLDTGGWLQDGKRDDKVRGQDDLLVPVDAKTVWVELLSKDVGRSSDILWPFVENVATGISLNETTWRGTSGTTHVSDEETSDRLVSVVPRHESLLNLPIWLSTNLISNRGEKGSVALLECWVVWVGGVKVECSVLSLQ